MPSAFSMTFGVLPSITATQELVVPRSIPMTLPMFYFLFSAAGRPDPRMASEGKFPRWTMRKLLRPPNYTLNAAIRGFLAHIGGPVWLASRSITDSRAALLMGPWPQGPDLLGSDVA